MRNVSLVALQLGLVSTSPFITSGNTLSRWNIAHTRASRFSHNFFRSEASSSLRLICSEFTHFLSTAIHVSALTFANHTTTEHKSFSGFTEVAVKNCLFHECRSADDGGGVYATQGTSITAMRCSIEETAFTCCSAARGGGFSIDSGFITVSKTCLVKCSATNFGQAFQSFSSAAVSAAYYHLSVSLSPSITQGGQAAISVRKYSHDFGYFNTSNNRNADVGIVMKTTDCKTIRIKYATVENCTGVDAFALQVNVAFALENAVIKNNKFEAAPFQATNGGRAVIHLYGITFKNNVILSKTGVVDGSLVITLEKSFVDIPAKSAFVVAPQVVNPEASEVQMSLNYWSTAACFDHGPTPTEVNKEGQKKSTVMWTLLGISLFCVTSATIIVLVFYCQRRKAVTSWAMNEGWSVDFGDE